MFQNYLTNPDTSQTSRHSPKRVNKPVPPTPYRYPFHIPCPQKRNTETRNSYTYPKQLSYKISVRTDQKYLHKRSNKQIYPVIHPKNFTQTKIQNNFKLNNVK